MPFSLPSATEPLPHIPPCPVHDPVPALPAASRTPSGSDSPSFRLTPRIRFNSFHINSPILRPSRHVGRRRRLLRSILQLFRTGFRGGQHSHDAEFSGIQESLIAGRVKYKGGASAAVSHFHATEKQDQWTRRALRPKNPSSARPRGGPQPAHALPRRVSDVLPVPGRHCRIPPAGGRRSFLDLLPIPVLVGRSAPAATARCFAKVSGR